MPLRSFTIALTVSPREARSNFTAAGAGDPVDAHHFDKERLHLDLGDVELVVQGQHIAAGIHGEASFAGTAIGSDACHVGLEHAAIQRDFDDGLVELDLRQHQPADDQREVGVHGLQSVERQRRVGLGGFRGGFRRHVSSWAPGAR